MRIHGIHVQGLRAPMGHQRLKLATGYNVIFAPDTAACLGLEALCRAFLYPNDELGTHELWREPGAKTPARAGISLSFASLAYRLIIDFDRGRMVLGRFEPKTQTYQRLSTDPDRIVAELRAAGLPGREEYRVLHAPRLLPELAPRVEPERPAPPVKDPRVEQRARLQRELAEAVARSELREKIERRLRELRRARERLVPLEANRERLRQELTQRSVLSEAVEDLEPRLERVKALEAEGARERVGIEQSRRELLDERAELRTIPARQDFPLWIGVSLVILGWLAGLLAHPVFYLFSVAGGVSVAAALYVSHKARERMGEVEAILAALRVQERAVEREFEMESAAIRSVMRTLGHGSVEELTREVAEYGGFVARLREVERELGEMKRALPEDESAEIRALEAQRQSVTPAREPDVIRTELARLAERSPPRAAEPAPREALPISGAATPSLPGDDEDLDALIRAAALIAGCDASEVRERIGPIVPIYVRALSGDHFLKARRHETAGWLLRGETRGDVVPYSSLPSGMRSAVHLAFRLAIFEAIAPESSIPLVLGPALPFERESQRLALARGLRRLGARTQVIQISCEKGDWAEQADRKLVIGA